MEKTQLSDTSSSDSGIEIVVDTSSLAVTNTSDHKTYDGPNYDGWSPQFEQFHSVLNFTHDLDTDEPGAVTLLGASLSKTVECRFNDGISGACWKGVSCCFTHPIGDEQPAKAQPRVLFLKSLGKKLISSTGTYFLANVCYINNPFDFYVIPNANFGCCCTLENASCLPKEDCNNGGLELSMDLHKKLGAFMGANVPAYQTTTYEVGQLVACKVPIPKRGLEWHRGIVNQTTKADPTEKISVIPVILIDLGMEIEVPFVYCATLPRRFTVLPPLAYRCSLYGIIPLGYKFSQEAIKYMERKVLNNEVLLEIRRTIFPSEQNEGSIFETPPYQVNLRLLGKQFKEKIVDNTDIIEGAWREAPTGLDHPSCQDNTTLEEHVNNNSDVLVRDDEVETDSDEYIDVDDDPSSEENKNFEENEDNLDDVDILEEIDNTEDIRDEESTSDVLSRDERMRLVLSDRVDNSELESAAPMSSGYGNPSTQTKSGKELQLSKTTVSSRKTRLGRTTANKIEGNYLKEKRMKDITTIIGSHVPDGIEKVIGWTINHAINIQEQDYEPVKEYEENELCMSQMNRVKLKIIQEKLKYDQNMKCLRNYNAYKAKVNLDKKTFLTRGSGSKNRFHSNVSKIENDGIMTHNPVKNGVDNKTEKNENNNGRSKDVAELLAKKGYGFIQNPFPKLKKDVKIPPDLIRMASIIK